MSEIKFSEAIEILEQIAVKPLMAILIANERRSISQEDYLKAYTAVIKSASAQDGKYALNIMNYFLKIHNDFLKEVHSILANDTVEAFPNDLIKYTTNWKIFSHWTTKIFSYLDRFYTKEKKMKNLTWHCLNAYKTQIVVPLKSKIYETVNEMIINDRRCLIVQRDQIRHIVSILDTVDISNPIILRIADQIEICIDESLSKPNEEDNPQKTLKEWFNNSIGPETQMFLLEKFLSAISRMTAIEYIQCALDYLNLEDDRKFEYISVSLCPLLDQLNFKHVIDDRIQDLAAKDTGFRHMFSSHKLNELELTYLFLKSSGKKETIKVFTDVMEEYIRGEGEKLFNHKELRKDPTKFIPELITFKKRFDKICEEEFQNAPKYQDSKNKAFSYFMNKEFYSKFLAYYADYTMKLEIRCLNEKEIDERLNDIINLFRCLNDKLHFQVEYSKKLTERLLSSKVQSINSEKSLITKLKAEAGFSFVNKMTNMIQDLETSKAKMDLYREQSHRGVPFGVQLDVKVLQHGIWDVNQKNFDRLIIPPLISSCIESFNEFYISRHKTQKLIWVFGLSTVEIEFLYLSKRYQATSTLAQLCILLSLEKCGKLRCNQVQEMIGMGDSCQMMGEVNALTYHARINPKKDPMCGVLSTDSLHEEFGMNSEIWINSTFVGNNIKLNTIPVATSKKTAVDEDEENKVGDQNIRAYKNMLIDATITRILKGKIGHKTTHNILISEVSKQIELFQAQPPLIKERIECLIEKCIIKRNDSDRNLYEYIA